MPHRLVLDVLGRTLAAFDDDSRIPCFGFGDVATGAANVFSFMPRGAPVGGLASVRSRYREIASSVVLHGPTSFGPVIRQAGRLAAESGDFTVLLLMADGQVSAEHEAETVDASAL